MGFFKKSVPSALKSTGLTIIAKGNKISGDMVIAGKLHIDGSVEGSIVSIEDVSISKTGEIKGKLKAKNVTVSGLLDGEVDCEHLHIVAGGKVTGTIISIDLTMDPQSHFFGESREKQVEKIHVPQSEITFGQQEVPTEKLESSNDLLDNLPNKVTFSGIKKEGVDDQVKSELDLNNLSFAGSVQSTDELLENENQSNTEISEKVEAPVDENAVDEKDKPDNSDVLPSQSVEMATEEKESLDEDKTSIGHLNIGKTEESLNDVKDNEQKDINIKKVKSEKLGTKKADSNTDITELKL